MDESKCTESKKNVKVHILKIGFGGVIIFKNDHKTVLFVDATERIDEFNNMHET